MRTYDLAHALDAFKCLDTARLVTFFTAYLGQAGQTISRVQAQEAYVRQASQSTLPHRHGPLLPAAAAALTDRSTKEAFRKVFTQIIDQIPGDPWVRLEEMKGRFGIAP